MCVRTDFVKARKLRADKGFRYGTGCGGGFLVYFLQY